MRSQRLPVSDCLQGWKRASAAALLAVLVLLGTVALHPAREEHDVLASTGDVYHPAASHPRQPHHFEEAPAARRPVCPVCLHHLRTGGSHLPVAASLAPPAQWTPPLHAGLAARTQTSQDPRSARAPPAFS